MNNWLTSNLQYLILKENLYQKNLKIAMQIPLLGLQLGNETDATIVGLNGKLKLTGGSDKSGVPMRNDVHGSMQENVFYFLKV